MKMDLYNLSHSSSDIVEASNTTSKLMDEKCSATKNKKRFKERNSLETCAHEGNLDGDSDFDKPLMHFSKKYLKRNNDTHGSSGKRDNDTHGSSGKRDNDTHGSSGKSQKPKLNQFTARWHPKDSCRPLLDDAPVFYPNEEEFKDALAYIASIREEGEKYGICRIVPPSSWKPQCPLKDIKFWIQNEFATRVQEVDKLQNREPMRKNSSNQCQKKRKRKKQLRFGMTRKRLRSNVSEDDCVDCTDEKFGFQEGSHYTLEKFYEYAEAFRKQYFGINGETGSNEKPSVEEIEGEYWRIVENPTDEVEVLYGADLKTAAFSSGFPKASTSLLNNMDEYVHSGWNLNNFPRLPGSVLSYEGEDISGVLVPWLYIGMSFSSFCWHVEDHHMYSINYMHFGDPKIWYGVPGSNACKFEEAMKKHLPKLFEEEPGLLHDLVTQLSPSILKSEGVPVYRAIQKSGEFVLTFPRGYHSGFNCGFNCAEAVNVAPIDWLPHGQCAIELYREQKRKTSISHDKLLFCAVHEAVKALLEISLSQKSSSDNLKWKKICEDGVLTSAVKKRVMMEEEQRETLSSISESKKMSKIIELAEKECFSCLYDLNMSAACCPCSPNKYSCLTHANDLCSCNSTPKLLLYRYSLDELKVLVRALEGNFDAIKRCALEIFNLDVFSISSECADKKQRDSDSNMTDTLPITNVMLDEKLLHDLDSKPEQFFNEWHDSKYNSDDVPRSSAECKSSVSSNHSSEARCSKDSPLVCNSSTKLFGIDLNDFMANSYSDESRNIGNPHKYHVEPLHYGTVELGKHWCNKEAIFPKGFRSQVQFLSVLNPTQTCFYISEILDAGLDGPLFKVTLKEHPEVTFMHSSATQCWDMVRERVNTEISKQRSLWICNLPPMQSINGLELFGLLSPSIVKVIEDLDTNRVCTEYWSSKLNSQPKNELNYLGAETFTKDMHNMLFGVDITVSEKDKSVYINKAPVQP